MASPVTSRGRETRERIVEGATALMVERGVGRTSLDDVRARTGVSKSQLYHYFTNKDDLVHAVIDRTVTSVLDAQPELADLSTWPAIEAWFDGLVELQVERHAAGGCPIGGLAGELADHDPAARGLLAEGYDRWEAPLRTGLATMRERGELSGDADPDRLATAVLALIQGGLVLTQTRRDPDQLRTALDAGLALMRAAGTTLESAGPSIAQDLHRR